MEGKHSQQDLPSEVLQDCGEVRGTFRERRLTGHLGVPGLLVGLPP